MEENPSSSASRVTRSRTGTGKHQESLNKGARHDSLKKDKPLKSDNQTAEEQQQFLTVKYNKGKRNLSYESDEESSGIQENKNEGNMNEDNGEDDTQSIHSNNSNISEHPIWRQNLGLKRYKVRALVKDFLEKSIGQKLAWITKELKGKIEYTFIKVEYRKKTKGSYIAIYFNKKEKLKKALDLEFINGDKEKFKLKEKSLNICIINANNMQRYTIIWNLPVSIKKNELKTELEHRYGKVESISTVLGEMWQKAYVTFVDPEDARNFIKSWSQIIGEDIVRVTPPGVTTSQLKERGEYAVRALGIPPGMNPAELYNEFKKIGAMTCYVPRNAFYARKRMAILSFESEEIKTGAIGYKWETEDFTVELMDMNVKACHRCYDITHLAKDCPVTQKTNERNIALQQRMDKFGKVWKRHNPSAYNRIQKRLDPSYVGVLKTNINRSHQQVRYINKETNTQQIDLFTTQLTNLQQTMENAIELLNNLTKRMEQAYNNNIGSGVGIMIKSNIAKHVYKIDKFEGHGICILLSFKGRVVFQIIGIYASNKYSSNNIILRKLKPWLYNHISQALSNNWISIIMGDWNATSDPSKDRFPVKTKTSPESNLLQSIIWSEYTDTYRHHNGDKQEYTFYQSFKEKIRSKSRIDLIWIHQSHEELIMDADIDDMTLIANSDHFCAHVTLDVSKYCDGTSYKKYKRVNYRTPRLWNLKMTDKENWEKFTQETEDAWEKQLQLRTNLKLVEDIWQKIKSTIINVGNKNLPKAKEPRNRSKIESTNNMNAQKLVTIETMKNKLTNKYELNIQSFPSAGLPKEKLEWVNNIKKLWITIRKLIKRELIREKKKEIKHKIELRQEFLSTKPKHMIDK
ncbi:25632_t:CDS:2, partial [Dentiscutata erythropus]